MTEHSIDHKTTLVITCTRLIIVAILACFHFTLLSLTNIAEYNIAQQLLVIHVGRHSLQSIENHDKIQ